MPDHLRPCSLHTGPTPVSRSCWRTQTRKVFGVQPIFGTMKQICCPLWVMFALTFQNHTNCPLTDFGGKTCIFSHPVYLFLREFSLQDFRGSSGRKPASYFARRQHRQVCTIATPRCTGNRYVWKLPLFAPISGREWVPRNCASNYRDVIRNCAMSYEIEWRPGAIEE